MLAQMFLTIMAKTKANKPKMKLQESPTMAESFAFDGF
jgi:hypothetical protein